MIEGIPDDFRDLLVELVDAGARFLVVGGYAVAVHGHPRATKDDFGEAWEERTELEVEGRKVPVLGLRALIKNKRFAGRPQDLADVDALERLREARRP